MAQINLAPGSQYIAAARRRRRVLYGLSTLIVVLVATVWGTVLLLERRANSQYERVQQELVSVEANITRAGSDVERITLFEQRLAALNQLLDHQHSWDTLFADLERLLPPQTILTQVQATNENSKVTIAGRTPNIDAVAQTFASLTTTIARPTVFASAQISGAQRDEAKDAEGNVVNSSYTFAADLTLAAPSSQE